MNLTLNVGLIALTLAQSGTSMILKVGEPILQAEKAMAGAKHEGKIRYAPIELSMVSLKKGSELRFWRVDRGVMIVRYSTASKLIEEIEYDISDTYSHAATVQFRFEVKTFDTESGLMQIQTHSPMEDFEPSKEETRANMERIERRVKEMEKEYEAEPAGADQPATQPADKTPVKDQTSTPTSRDSPR